MSTPTITLSQLHSDLLSIYAHPLSSTNVTNIQHTAGGAVYFETDTGELEAQLAHTEAKRATEAIEHREEINELLAEISKLKAALHGVADKAKEALTAK
jgi:hypothetical protein